MRICIITRSLPPHHCGVGAHSLCLAGYLRAEGHHVILCAGRGKPGPGIRIIGDDWRAVALQRVRVIVESERPDHVILQFTPLAFSRGEWRVDRAVLREWRRWRARWSATLIAHETYFRTLSQPKTLFRGSWEKFVLKEMSRAAHLVCSASQPLIEEASSWGLERPPLLLPIGSNIPVAKSDRRALRRRHGVDDNGVVLTIFGGGNNLKWCGRHVDLLETRLNVEGIPHVWMFLGGAKPDWFHLSAPVIEPGWLELEEISAYLQMSDLFLMPHWGGLCAKRGTLMAAMQHGLPVVGTRGYMTDLFWENVEGVRLRKTRDAEGFCEVVLSLSRSPEKRRAMGEANRCYYVDNMDWTKVADSLLAGLRVTQTTVSRGSRRT